jgi:hypothetical protein
MERWNDGMMEECSNSTMEEWKNGMMDEWNPDSYQRFFSYCPI